MPFPFRRPPVPAGLTLLALLVLGCDGSDNMPAPAQEKTRMRTQSASEACNDLAGTLVPSKSIGLPTRGARVTSANWVAATDALPEHCDVRGVILAENTLSPYDINFRVNLPSLWNQKAMHYGGSGYNGTVVAATDAAPSAPPDTLVPLALGYATFGSDSGHVGSNAQFGISDEAVVNFGYAQMKKTRDVAVELIRQRYGKLPQRTYWIGSGQGGREGLMVAQRFPNDYDGVIAQAPLVSFTGLHLQGNRVAKALAANGGAGWLNEAKVKLVQSAVLKACDTVDADGLVDGVVANYGACQFDPRGLRCENGTDAGDQCLSDAQIQTLQELHTPMQFGYTVAHEVSAYPGWGWGGENDPAGNWAEWVTGENGTSGGRMVNWGNQFVRYFIAKDAAGFNPLEFRPIEWQGRIQQLSPVLDATNPDLSAFHARGGKLILQEFGADYAHSPQATIDYYKSVVKHMTPEAADKFVRLYFTPGAAHGGAGGSGWPATGIDWISVLEKWVEQGQAPDDKLTQTSHSSSAPYSVTAERPLCRYPKYPRYDGTGDPPKDPNKASSYTCS